VPFYTPEPDVVHEIIGHANMLANPVLADLYEVRGRASLRWPTTTTSLQYFSRVFWFSLEFGVVHEGGELKAYGAGLLSSFGEIDVFRRAEVRPVGHRADGHARLRHHPVPAGAVRGRVVRPHGPRPDGFLRRLRPPTSRLRARGLSNGHRSASLCAMSAIDELLARHRAFYAADSRTGG
jgi:hypothetical protein